MIRNYKIQDKKVEIITPLKSWWSGDSRVEEFMPEVSKAIKRHHDWPSSEYTDIYNRAYEAVYEAIMKYTNVSKHDVRAVAEECREHKLSEIFCQWKVNEDGVYETDCGNSFHFDDSAKPDIYIICPYCGKSIKE